MKKIHLEEPTFTDLWELDTKEEEFICQFCPYSSSRDIEDRHYEDYHYVDWSSVKGVLIYVKQRVTRR